MIPRHMQISTAILLVTVVILGFYVHRMRGRAAQGVPVADNRPVAPPVAGPTEQVTLYVAYDDPGVLRAEAARIPLPSGRQERAQELLHALIQRYVSRDTPHVLPSGSEIRDVYMVDPGLAVIDTNTTFADNHRSGVLVEQLTVASLVETLAANLPGINRIKILVNGTQRETLAGHADLAGFYDTGAVSKLAEQLVTAPQ
jgi:hypothetical protein